MKRMKSSLLALASISCLSAVAPAANAGRRDGDGELIQKKKQPSVTRPADLGAYLIGLFALDSTDSRDNHLGNSAAPDGRRD